MDSNEWTTAISKSDTIEDVNESDKHEKSPPYDHQHHNNIINSSIHSKNSKSSVTEPLIEVEETTVGH